jgi:hypothetical protein
MNYFVDTLEGLSFTRKRKQERAQLWMIANFCVGEDVIILRSRCTEKKRGFDLSVRSQRKRKSRGLMFRTHSFFIGANSLSFLFFILSTLLEISCDF